MLFLKTLLVTSLLIFGLVQCSRVPDKTSSAELLAALVKKHVDKGLKDYRHSISSLQSPEIKAILRGAGEYVVIKLDIADQEAKKLMSDVDGVFATLFGHRQASPSDLNIENAARLLMFSFIVNIIRMIIKSTLKLFNSPFSELF